MLGGFYEKNFTDTVQKVDADIKPFRKTVLSIIDDHMYLIQSYKYDQNLDVWLNSKVTSFLNEDGESVNGIVHICKSVCTTDYFDALILYEGFSEIQGE